MKYQILRCTSALLMLAGCGAQDRPGAARPATHEHLAHTSQPSRATGTTIALDSPERPRSSPLPAVTPDDHDWPLRPAVPRYQPTIAPTASIDVMPVVSAPHHFVHIVQPGETVDALDDYAAPPESILRYNHQHSAVLRPGQPLIVGATHVPPEPQLISVEQGNPAQPRVALTFDAGSNSAPTAKLLDVLQAHNVRVTFFLTGKWMLENPTLTRRIAADDHEIANHSFNHPDFTTLDDETIIRQLAETDRLAEQIAGTSTRPYFRFPFGAFNRRALATVIDAGYLPVGWTLDSLDSVGQPRTPEFLTQRVTARLRDDQLHGAIILMHCGSLPTAEALPAILERFAAKGLRVTTVSEVLGP